MLQTTTSRPLAIAMWDFSWLLNAHIAERRAWRGPARTTMNPVSSSRRSKLMCRFCVSRPESHKLNVKPANTVRVKPGLKMRVSAPSADPVIALLAT